MSGSASKTLQYTSIGAFIAIVLLGLVYFCRSVNRGRRPRSGGDANDTGHVFAFTPEQLAGLTPDDLAVLPKFTYHAASPGRVGKGKAAPADDSCAVCLDGLQEGALVRMLPSCRHCFHASCVDVWLLSHATCPVCRAIPAAPQTIRLGVASMSPPLRPCAKGGPGTMSQVNNAAAAASPVTSSPAHMELFIHASSVDLVMSPSPTSPMTLDSRVFLSTLSSPVMTDPHLVELV